jgi:UDP-N-acetylmuramoyl-tripeptide--D-alanyl-D-alanine ligase
MMRRSAGLLRPDVGIILNVLRTHTTAFQDIEHHAAEKAVMLECMKAGGAAILNEDDPLVARMARGAVRHLRVRTFGTTASADYRAEQPSSKWPGRLTFVLHRGASVHRVETQLVGVQWLYSALAVLAAADTLGIGLVEATRALRGAEPFAGRLQPVRVPGGAIVLRDDYNGSIDTIEASLRVLQEATAPRKLVVVTDMSDFGRNRKQRLKYLAKRSAEVADAAVFIGELADYGRRRAIEAGLSPDSVHAFPSLRPAAEFLRGELRTGDLMLLKGRTTDHATRIYFALLGPVGCWKEYCPKRMLCDICWELDVTPAQMRQAEVVVPGAELPSR